MLQFFRNNQLTTIPLVVLYFIVLSMGLLLNPMPYPEIMPQWNTLMYYFWFVIGRNSFTIHFFWIVLLLIQVFGLNALINYFKLSKRFTYITTISVILTYNFIQGNVAAIPILIANIFLALAIFNLFNTYINKGLNGGIFNATAFLSLASLFYTPYLLFLIVFWIGLYVLRGLHLKENIVFLLGALVPFILMGTNQFLLDNFSNWISTELIGEWQFFQLNFSSIDFIFIVVVCVVALVFLWLISICLKLQSKTTLQEKSYIYILYLILLAAIVIILLKGNFALYKLNILAIPISLLMSLGLQAISSNKRAEIWHWLLLGFALFIQFQALF